MAIFENKRNKNNIDNDDVRVLRTYIEYMKDGKTLKHIVYEMETIDTDGTMIHFWKVLKFVRIIRLPKDAKQSSTFMNMHSQVLSSIWENNINLVTVIANLIKPALGLLFLYGVQGIGQTLEEASYIAEQDYEGLVGMLQGTYRTLEFRPITNEESEWLREKMYSMKCMTTLRGIPIPRNGGVDAGKQGNGGSTLNLDAQNTTEEFILGMSDKEYVIQILSTPVKAVSLRKWLTQTAKEMTRWQSQMTGSKSMNFGITIPMMYMANLGASQGWSHGYSDASSIGESESVGHSEGTGTSLSESFGTSHSTSSGTSHSVSDGTSTSHSTSSGTSHSVGTSHTVSDGISNSISSSQGTSSSTGISSGTSNSTSSGTSESTSIGNSSGFSSSQGTSSSSSQSEGSSSSTSHSQGTSQSTGQSYSQSAGTSQGYSTSQGASYSSGYNSGWSQGTSSSVSNGTSGSQSNGWSQGTSQSQGTSNSFSQSQGYSESNGSNVGWNESMSNNQGNNLSFAGFGSNAGSGVSQGQSLGASHSWGTSGSNGMSSGTSSSQGSSQGTSGSVGSGWSHGTSSGISNGMSGGYSSSSGMSASSGQNWGISNSVSSGQSASQGTSESWGTSTGSSFSQSVSQGTSSSSGISQSLSNSSSQGISNSVSNGISNSTSSSQGISTSTGMSSGTSHSVSNGTSESWGTSQSESYGTGTSHGVSHGTSQSTSDGTSHSTGTGSSTSESTSTSKGTSKSTSTGTSTGTSGGISSGTSSSMGASPSFSMGTSYQFLDQETQNIVDLLTFQNQRLMRALNGYGAFYTDVFIATPDDMTKKRANSLAKSAWFNENSLVCPLQVMELSEEEQQHLLYHFNCFSPDTTMDEVPGSLRSYRYTTILLSDEYTAYTHLPRVSEGGIYSDVNDIPKFAVPSMKTGEIYMGKIISGERYTQQWGYKTPFDYRIAENEIMHGFFTGESRSGKTVAATRFVAELANNVIRKPSGKRMRIVCLDPKQDWRILAKFVEPERFKFFSLGNPEFLPINLNICKIPKNVYPQQWVDGLIEIYCRAYGLGERGKSVLSETFFKLYEEAGVFDENWREVAPERSAAVSMTRIYETMMQFKLDLEDPAKSGKGRVGNDVRDAYSRVLDRMQVFGRSFSIESKLFGQPDGMGIDELIGEDDVVVLESYGLESTFKNFIFGVITSAFFKYAQAHEGGFKAPDQYETLLVIEEANEVLVGQDSADSGGGSPLSGQSEFEKILDQSAGLGLFIFSITQKIAAMPTSVIANSGLVFAGKISRSDDVTTVVRKIGREERYEDRDLVKWFPRSPIGWFVCRSSRNFDFKETEPSLVAIDHLSVDPPTNAELEHLDMKKRLSEKLSSSNSKINDIYNQTFGRNIGNNETNLDIDNAQDVVEETPWNPNFNAISQTQYQQPIQYGLESSHNNNGEKKTTNKYDLSNYYKNIK